MRHKSAAASHGAAGSRVTPIHPVAERDAIATRLRKERPRDEGEGGDQRDHEHHTHLRRGLAAAVGVALPPLLPARRLVLHDGRHESGRAHRFTPVLEARPVAGIVGQFARSAASVAGVLSVVIVGRNARTGTMNILVSAALQYVRPGQPCGRSAARW